LRVWQGEGLADSYLQIYRAIKGEGKEVTIRGQRCMELPEPVTLTYTKPGNCFMYIPKRRFNIFFALAEVVWILSGRGDIEWIANYNSKMRDFNDGGPENHGAYGVRMRKWPYLAPKDWDADFSYLDQITETVKLLKSDSTSRQAIIVLWDPARDRSEIKTLDRPCNCLVDYKLRDGVLDQTVFIRSNDLVWGTPVNAIQFTHLQALVAGELKVKMGTLTYVIQNIHYYLDLYPETLAILDELAHWKGKLDSLSVENFDTVTEGDFRHYTAPRCCMGHLEHGNDYWREVIPRTVGIFDYIKTLKDSTLLSDLINAAELLNTLPEPIRTLGIDFYAGSSKTFYQGIAKAADELKG
jgi:thymidylate synthase